ncbi:hypothetical protein PHYSODRAFT_294394 [Phytophthora sojae]|uniref:Helitron helicase-like domain-containing protein n=1 Tax=Phytophthora sojae (strain P6497) TaxID=1094619 RepID=G4YGG9_PHYSP|nr:hypothetical protein PHYSODRAFT_294394 [Phytophthora sojae]EGZ29082.1 hypothetical protein PHYSODRAFT_294394 [Phytophthora sojae]|eukprot:XP_009516357.1 hypothetical protein PHYSODRAFT_294394 [Phytophthora sojae]
MPDHLLEENQHVMQECLKYTTAKLGMIATSNPAACSQYYNYVMEIVIDVILNWDRDKHCSKPGGGLFGVTEAFYAATETQGSTGNLHGYMLIRVEGMPATVKEYYQSCQLDDVKKRLLEYVESIASSNFPANTEVCPSCHESKLTPMPLSMDAFQRPRKNQERPITAKCTGCRRNFGENEIIRGQLTAYALANSLDIEDFGDTAIKYHIAKPQPLPLPDDHRAISNLLVSRALIEYQAHHWYHCRSCFKCTRRTPKGNVCRMFFPKETSQSTHWTEQDTMQLTALVNMSCTPPSTVELVRSRAGCVFSAADPPLEGLQTAGPWLES